MSSTLTIYAVSFARLTQVPGSRDRRLLEEVLTECEWFLSEIDELADEEAEVPPCREAVAQIIEGAPMAAHCGYVYGYALEAICACLGRELTEVSAISRATRWLDTVDLLLDSSGVPVRLSNLVFGVCPVKIPTPDDSPCVGSWAPEVIPAALQAVRRLDLAPLDSEMAATVTQIRDWLETVSADPEDGLIGFLS